MKIKTARSIASALTTGAVLFSSLSPLAFADTNLTISGNGADSDSSATVTTTQTVNVVQNNTADIDNDVDSSSNTGGNVARNNTGGGTAILSGNADNTVSVLNAVNINRAILPGNTSNGGINTTITGNGADSDNTATVTKTDSVSTYQDNQADIDNDIDVRARTGNNRASENTGGDTTILTGRAETQVDVLNKANANFATPFPSAWSNNGSGWVNAVISGNGADSDNATTFDLRTDRTTVQNNDADVDNDVEANANSGRNDARNNTGGSVLVDTGSARSQVDVTNALNFNGVDNGGDYLTTVHGTIEGNGFDSDNTLNASLAKILSEFQTNNADLENDVENRARSGNNDANANTGGSSSDETLVFSGNASSSTLVNSGANVNLAGQSASLELPGGLLLSLHFSIHDMLSLLGL